MPVAILRTASLLVAFLALSCVREPVPPRDLPGQTLLILGATIVEPEHHTVSTPQDVLIVEGRIVEVATAGTISPDRAATVLSAEGLYALPGLIDVHAHIGDGGLGAQSEADRRGALEQFLRYGVTTIFVPGGGGGNDHQLARWKERCDTGEFPCPDLTGSGALITAPGSHPIGTIWGLPDDVAPEVVYERGAVAMAEDQPVGPLLDKKLKLGVDGIKIVIEDGIGPRYPMPRLSRAKVAELVEAAHQRGLRVFAHISRAHHVVDAVAGGIDGIMHSCEDLLPDAVLVEMADRGIFYVATLSLYDGFIDHAFGRFAQEPFAIAGVSARALESLTDETWRNSAHDTPEEARAIQAALYENLRRAAAAGVPLALGTDVNNPTVFPGYSAHEELALMVEAGLSPAQALTAATRGGAAFLGKGETLGKIAPGYEADILLLSANPLENILATRNLHTVLRNGRRVEGIPESHGSAAPN